MPKKRLAALITFDVDDTLYSSAEFVRKARRNALEAMRAVGVEVDLEEALAELDEVVAEFTSNDNHHFDRLLRRLPAEIVAGVDRAVAVAAAVAAYHDTIPTDFTPYPDAVEVLRDLKKAGYRLGIASQGLTVKQAEKIVRLQVLPYLDRRALFFSDRIGISKVNPKFFRCAAESLSLPPECCLHVGDRPDRDIDPANAAGWVTVINRRSGRYHRRAGETPAAYDIQNFWDLQEIIERDFHPPR